MTQGYDFRINTDKRLVETLTDTLHDLGALVPSPTQSLTLELLDTFDWRLYRAGIGLRMEWHGKRGTLICHHVNRPQRAVVANTEYTPRFHDELPAGPMRRQLADPMAMRALMPRATLRNRRQLYQLLDGERKTVARLYRERLTAKPGVKALLLLRIEPLRGYEKLANAVAASLATLPALAPLDGPWESEVCRWAGAEPGDYQSKLVVKLEPQTRSDAALRELLNHLTAALELNTPGMLQAIDTEFLHDYRVAVRRTRSALSQLRQLIPQRTYDRFCREFAWLGEITGPARDLDVYLLNFDHYLSLLPEPMGANLEPLRHFLGEQQRLAYADLNRHLNTARYRRLLTAWRRYLATPLPAHPRLPDARLPIKTVADKRIWHTYRKVIKCGRKINDDSPAQELHRLRIRCKRLRYLLEFFRSLYPKRRVGHAVDALKELQDVLGRFQDLEIQQHELRRFGEQMSAHHGDGQPARIALDALIAKLESQQQESRRRFAACFRHFSAADRHDEFSALFHAPAKSDP